MLIHTVVKDDDNWFYLWLAGDTYYFDLHIEDIDEDGNQIYCEDDDEEKSLFLAMLGKAHKAKLISRADVVASLRESGFDDFKIEVWDHGG